MKKRKEEMSILNRVKKILKIEMADIRAEEGTGRDLYKSKRRMGWFGSMGLAALIALGGAFGVPGCKKQYDMVIEEIPSGITLRLNKGEIVENRPNVRYLGKDKDDNLLFEYVGESPSGKIVKGKKFKAVPGDYTIIDDSRK